MVRQQPLGCVKKQQYRTKRFKTLERLKQFFQIYFWFSLGYFLWSSSSPRLIILSILFKMQQSDTRVSRKQGALGMPAVTSDDSNSILTALNIAVVGDSTFYISS